MYEPSYPIVSADEVGWLTESQMREVDRVMVEELHIQLIQMMENAGRNLARLVMDLTDPSSVAVYAGSGGNGGGGLVAARHLANAGVEVSVCLSTAVRQMRGVSRHQLDILQRMGIEIAVAEHHRANVAVDALVGYSLRGAPRGAAGELIRTMVQASDVVISLDTPSGLDVTTGEAPGDVIRAAATMTLALPKTGLRTASSVGDLYVADIAVPPSVLHELDVQPASFATSPIVRIQAEPASP